MALVAGIFLVCQHSHAGYDPHDSVAVALRAGRYRVAQRLLESNPDTSDTATYRIRRGLCLLNTGEPTEADREFVLASARGYQAPYKDYWRASAWRRAGDISKALRGFERLCISGTGIARDSAHVWSLRCAVALGDDDAVRRAENRLTSRTDDLAAVGWLSRVWTGGEEWERAWLILLEKYAATREAYSAALHADSVGWAPRGYLAVALAGLFERHGDGERAIRTWRTAIEDPALAGRRGELLYRLASLLADQRHYGDAARSLTRVLDDTTASDRWPQAMRLMAKVERRRNRETHSREWERRFVESYPSHSEAPDALWNIAMSFDRVGRYDEAVRAYQALAARFPREEVTEQGLWRIGFCLYRTGDYDGAYDRFAMLSRTARNFVVADQANYWAGRALQAAGRTNDAHEVWDLSAAYSPRTYYAVASAVAAGRPVVPPEDEQPPANASHADPTAFPSFEEARWLSSVGQVKWARTVLTDGTRSRANSVAEREALADAFEGIADYSLSLRWRWRAMWARVTEDRYHELPPDLLRRVWPDFFRREVVAAAEEHELDPALIWAIIRQESVFDPDVTSRADARGLMQIIPATGRGLAREMKIEEFSPEDLYDPSLNIRMGAHYVAHLLDRFKDVDLIAAAYNAGPGNAVRWSRAESDDRDVMREAITYSETRNYVKLVLKNYLIYRALYPHRIETPP